MGAVTDAVADAVEDAADDDEEVEEVITSGISTKSSNEVDMDEEAASLLELVVAVAVALIYPGLIPTGIIVCLLFTARL